MSYTAWAKGSLLLSHQDIENQAFVINQYIKSGDSLLGCVTELTGEDIGMYAKSAADAVDEVMEVILSDG